MLNLKVNEDDEVLVQPDGEGGINLAAGRGYAWGWVTLTREQATAVRDALTACVGLIYDHAFALVRDHEDDPGCADCDEPEEAHAESSR